MNRMLGLSALTGAMLFASGAFAFPAGPMSGGGIAFDNGLVTHVAQGCGPGGWRGPYGGCRYGRPVYGRPPGWAYRPVRCWIRPTPWGPRRVCG